MYVQAVIIGTLIDKAALLYIPILKYFQIQSIFNGPSHGIIYIVFSQFIFCCPFFVHFLP